MTLQHELEALRERIRGLVPPAKQAVTDAAIADWQQQNLAARALQPGTSAPAFTLPDADGKPVRLSDVLALGPVLLKFFRGRWCPYCVAELEAWRDRHAELRAAGAFLLALSPQTAKQSGFMVEQHRLPFPLLVDSENKVAAQYGVAYALPGAMRDLYQSVFINLPFINGDQSWTLPIPALFVIARDGRITHNFADPDFTHRPEPDAVLCHLHAVRALET